MSAVAWVLCASDLGIRVTAPRVFADRFGQPLEFAALVHDFGAAAGTLVWYMPDPVPASRLPFAAFFVSILNPDLYGDYDRERFIALLAGWGWTGKTDPPSWLPSR